MGVSGIIDPDKLFKTWVLGSMISLEEIGHEELQTSDLAHDETYYCIAVFCASRLHISYVQVQILKHGCV